MGLRGLLLALFLFTLAVSLTSGATVERTWLRRNPQKQQQQQQISATKFISNSINDSALSDLRAEISLLSSKLAELTQRLHTLENQQQQQTPSSSSSLFTEIEFVDKTWAQNIEYIPNMDAKLDLVGALFGKDNELPAYAENMGRMAVTVTYDPSGIGLSWKAFDVPGAVHSVHVFDGDFEIFHEELATHFGYMIVPYSQLVPQAWERDKMELWVALVGDEFKSGDLAVLASSPILPTESPGHFKMEKPQFTRQAKPDPFAPLPEREEAEEGQEEEEDEQQQQQANIASLSSPATSASVTSASKTIKLAEEEKIFSEISLADDVLRQMAKDLGKHLAENLERDGMPIPIQIGSTSKDREITSAAWDFFRKGGNCSLVRDYLKTVDGANTEYGHPINILTRASVVKNSTINASWTQLMSYVYAQMEDNHDHHHAAARRAFAVDQFEAHHWMELLSSIVAHFAPTQVLVESPVVEESVQLLMLFAKSDVILPGWAPSFATPLAVGEKLSKATPIPVIIASFLEVLRTENRLSFSLMAKSRLSRFVWLSLANRAQEFDTVLAWNLCHPGVASIVLLSSDDEDTAYIADLRQNLENGDKLSIVQARLGDETVQYRHLFALASERLSGKAVVILHGDCLLGEGFGNSLSTGVQWGDVSFLEGKMVAISRHNGREGELNCCETSLCIDGFLFVPPLSATNLLNFFQNEWWAEFHVLAHMCFREKLGIYNACKEMKVFHFHASRSFKSEIFTARNLRTENLVCPAYFALSSSDNITGELVSSSGEGDYSSSKNVKIIPQPCCEVEGKAYLVGEKVSPPTERPFLRLINRSPLNNTAIDSLCFEVVVGGGVIHAPERGHETITIQSGAQIINAIPRKVSCLVHEQVPSGPITVRIEVLSRTKELILSQELSLFFVRNDEDVLNACNNWIAENPSLRSMQVSSKSCPEK